MSDDLAVRELLRRVADETGATPVDPRPVVVRAKRRLARDVALLATSVLLLLGASVAGLAGLDATRSRPLGIGPPPAGRELPGTVAISSQGQVVLVHPDGSTTRLTGDPGPSTPVAWSPDGGRLLVSRQYGSVPCPKWYAPSAACYGASDLYVVPVDGSGSIRLTDDRGPESGAVWSPDGSTIAFGKPGNGIHLVSADGGEVRPLVAADDGPFSWSPDGTRIAFSASTGTTKRRSDIFTVDVASGSVTRLTTSDTTVCGAGTTGSILSCGGAVDPVWSPDGASIAFVVHRVPASGLSRPVASAVEVIGADGSDPHRVAWGSGGLAWSPDGSRLAFSWEGGVFVVGVDGSDLRDLAASGSSPRWSPDGSALTFGCPEGVCLVYVDSTVPVQLPGPHRTSGGIALWRPEPV